jgi:nucleotide-binding universal stress UspA family protein
MVLIPLDRSADAQAAVPIGAQVAGRLNGTLRLFTVVVPNSDEAEAADYLHQVAEQNGAPWADVEVVASGAPATTILRSAQARDALICMATRSRGRLGELLLGSLSQTVVARSPSPVMLVGPAAHSEPAAGNGEPGSVAGIDGTGPIIVPLDGSSTAEKALAAAAGWARQFGVGLHLVQVVSGPTKDGVESDPASLVQRAEPWTGQTDLVVTAEIRDGDPADVVAAVAREQQSPLIVLTSRGETAEKNRALSAIARAMVRDAPVPVLIAPHHAVVVTG